MNNDCGPAFPMGIITDFETGKIIGGSNGMTLRDYFAAKAMQGLLASDVKASIDDFAKRAYQMADFMIKERNNGN